MSSWFTYAVSWLALPSWHQSECKISTCSTMRFRTKWAKRFYITSWFGFVTRCFHLLHFTASVRWFQLMKSLKLSSCSLAAHWRLTSASILFVLPNRLPLVQIQKNKRLNKLWWLLSSSVGEILKPWSTVPWCLAQVVPLWRLSKASSLLPES